MKKFWSLTVLIFHVTNLIQAIDNYKITALPKDFYDGGSYHVLNNLGQVSGTFSPSTREAWEEFYEKVKKTGKGDNSFDPFAGAKAAYWDPTKGIITINLPAYKSTGRGINDSGFLAVAFNENKLLTNQPLNQEVSQTVLWDTKNNVVKRGPTGLPYDINPANLILINMHKGLRTIWNPNDNSVIKQPNQQINEKYFSNIFKAFNDKGSSRLIQPNPDLELFFDGKQHLLTLNEGRFYTTKGPIAYHNNNDEVVALITVKNKNGNDEIAVAKWQKGQEMTRSVSFKEIPKLKDYSNFGIRGFNDKGQILISAAEKYPTDTWDLFLLSPM